MSTRSQTTNCRRLMGTIERHSTNWRIVDSKFLNSVNVSFIHTTGSVTIDLFPNAFCISLWERYNDTILRWAAIPYGGKMFRSLKTVSNAFIKGRRRVLVDNLISEGTEYIPLDLFYDSSSIKNILLATISDKKIGSLVRGWTGRVTIPDKIIKEVEDIIGLSPEDAVPETELKCLDSDSKDIECVLPVPTGPVRIIRI